MRPEEFRRQVARVDALCERYVDLQKTVKALVHEGLTSRFSVGLRLGVLLPLSETIVRLVVVALIDEFETEMRLVAKDVGVELDLDGKDIEHLREQMRTAKFPGYDPEMKRLREARNAGPGEASKGRQAPVESGRTAVKADPGLAQK